MKTKNIIVSALVVLFAGLLWFQFVYSPMESKASKARSAAHDANVSADNLRQAINGTSGSKKGTKKNDVSTELMTAAIPVDGAEAAFLRSIDEIRVASGASWQSVTPVAPVLAGTVSTVTVGITVDGTEEQIAKYMSLVTNLRRIFIIDNVTVAPKAGGEPAGAGTPVQAQGAIFIGPKLEMQISGRIFSQPAAVSAPISVPGSATTPVTGAPAPTGGATAPPGVQKN